jgi:hypothetical protein
MRTVHLCRSHDHNTNLHREVKLTCPRPQSYACQTQDLNTEGRFQLLNSRLPDALFSTPSFRSAQSNVKMAT